MLKADSPFPSKLRVAFLTPTLLLGGAERWLITMARRCDPRRIEWTGTALTDRAPASEQLCREMAAFMPIFGGPGAGGLAAADYVTRCRSARAALEAAVGEADVLITWGVRNLPQLVNGLEIPVVLVSHGSGGWSIRSLKVSERGATRYVAVSEPARTAFSPEIRSRVTIIHNGIDVERCAATVSREETRHAWGFGEDHRLIGYIGRYSVEKNPAAAARAAAELGGPYHAVYAGEGWMEKRLREEVRAIAGSRAVFVPPDRNMGNILSAVDVFALASPAEGFSLSMAEAWYCGVPVVATRVGAVPELEQRHGQLVCPVPIDPSATDLARAVEEATSNGFQGEVVPRAREVVERYYTAGAMAGRWTDYLDSRFGSRAEPCELSPISFQRHTAAAVS